MHDLTRLGFADDLALVAGLEEVGRTCCPQVNFIRCFYSSFGRGDTDEKPDLKHDQNRRNLLDHCRARNIKLNKKKFHLKCSEVSFTGHVMTRNGLKTDPKKVKALIKME